MEDHSKDLCNILKEWCNDVVLLTVPVLVFILTGLENLAKWYEGTFRNFSINICSPCKS